MSYLLHAFSSGLVLHWQGETCPSHQVLVFRRVPATCLIMRLPYPVPPNRFRRTRGWMLPPAVSSHATPAKGARDPKNTPRSNAPPSPVFPREQPSRGGMRVSTIDLLLRLVIVSVWGKTVRTPALVIVAIFHESHSRKSSRDICSRRTRYCWKCSNNDEIQRKSSISISSFI